MMNFKILQKALKLCEPNKQSSVRQKILFADALRAVCFITRDCPSWEDGAAVMLLRSSINNPVAFLDIIKEEVSEDVAELMACLVDIRLEGTHINDLRYDIDELCSICYDHFSIQHYPVQILQAYYMIHTIDTTILRGELTKDFILLNETILSSMLALPIYKPQIFSEAMEAVDRARFHLFGRLTKIPEPSLN